MASTLATSELPGRRVEGWRWSDLRVALGADLPPHAPPATTAAALHAAFASLHAAEILFEDGRITLWPEKVQRGQPAVYGKDTSASGQPRGSPGSPMAAVAVKELADEWFPIVESRKSGGVVHVRHIGGATRYSRHSRVGVKVRAGEKLTLVETYEGEAAGFTNALTECFVESGGELTRIVLQPSTNSATIVSTAEVFLRAGSTFRQFALSEGAKLARIETDIQIDGAGAAVEMSGVYLAGAGRHADFTSQVRFDAEGGQARQIVRGAARKGGRGVFQGKFRIGRDGQKTDAKMAHNALLLEEGAEVFAKPELEIYADDVQCAHGNTAGQLDEAAVFYLRQRGLPEVEARALITRAFLLEAIPDWLSSEVREQAETHIDAWLGAARA